MSIGTGPAPARLERASTPTSDRVLSPLARGSLRFLLIAGAVTVVGYALVHLRLVVVPLIVAILVSTLLVPPTRWLCRRGMPRAPAVLVVLAAALTIFGTAIALIAPAVVSELGTLGERVKEGIDTVTAYVASGPFGLTEDEVDRLVTRVSAQAQGGAGSVAQGVVNASLLAVEVFTGLVLAVVLTFFLVYDGAGVWRWIVGLVPSPRQDDVERFGTQAWTALSGYVRGVAIVALVDALAIGLALVLIGVPLVVPLAVLTFLAAFIPLIGAVVAGSVAALVALVTNGVVAALLVVGAVTLIQQLEGDFLYPVVVGRAISLHAIAILLSVTAGGVLLGVVGAALAVPVAAVVWAGVKTWREDPAL